MFDELERFIDILESLHPQTRFRRISTEGFIAEDFEEVDEDDAVGEVCHEALDGDLTGFDLVIEPGDVSLPGLEGDGVRRGMYHFVNVFSWTFTHCFSNNTMAACQTTMYLGSLLWYR
jgi:hypothetical protein